MQNQSDKQEQSNLQVDANKKKQSNKLCAICGDVSANWYYGVISCEACKVIITF